jgi:hypothetical protein
MQWHSLTKSILETCEQTWLRFEVPSVVNIYIVVELWQFVITYETNSVIIGTYK